MSQVMNESAEKYEQELARRNCQLIANAVHGEVLHYPKDCAVSFQAPNGAAVVAHIFDDIPDQIEIGSIDNLPLTTVNQKLHELHSIGCAAALKPNSQTNILLQNCPLHNMDQIAKLAEVFSK